MAFSVTTLPHRLYRLFHIDRRRRDRQGPVVLSIRRIYILPTRYGLLYGLLVFLLTLGATNYDNSTGFLLAFLLAGLGMVAAIHTYRNLSGLQLRGGRGFRVFCGEQARYTVYVDNTRGDARPALCLHPEDEDPQACAGVCVDIPAAGHREVELRRPARRRGWSELGTVVVATTYPLGLFRAWSRLRLDVRCLAYPQPEGEPVPPAPAARSSGGRDGRTAEGNDDFLGHRRYQPSDSPRHVDWKAAARGREPLTKLFAHHECDERWLDWEALAGLDTEARLRRLCRWVLDAERSSHRYGLRLPGLEIPLNRGPAHLHRCLEALALHPRKP